MKDVPMTLAPEFALVAIAEREVPLDAFVSNKYESLDDMPPGAVVGTSSLRRESQIHAQYPMLAVTSLRGNLDTRLRKLDEGQYDAIILAAAGLTRLGLASRIRGTLPSEVSLPAAGQGALGIEALSDRPEVAAWIAPLADPPAACVRERATSRALAGSCEVPLGAYAEVQGGELWLRGFVALPDGSRIARAERRGPIDQPEALGLALAETCAPTAPTRSSPACRSWAASPSPGAPSSSPARPGRPTACARPSRPWAPSPVLSAPHHRPGGRPGPAAGDGPAAGRFSLAFFVSPNAVRFALDAMLPVAPWPAGVQVATVGKGSEAALAPRLHRVIAPSIGFDSEAVLALPAFQADAVAGRRVLCCAATAAAICWATPSPPAAPGSNTSPVTTAAAPPTTRRSSSTVPAPAASTP
jgi:hydroxymethylbilane synthase